MIPSDGASTPDLDKTWTSYPLARSFFEIARPIPKEFPAYEYFKEDKSEVFCDKDLFFRLDEQTQLYAILEESYVLALERSQIPFKDKVDPKKSFDISLMKICTSITSGWFREFAWENYHKIQSLYDKTYVQRFWQAEKTYLAN